MDYEKKYKEALEKLRNFYRDYDTVSCLIDVKEELANLFPELRECESEDERIRQEIIDYLSTVDDKELIPYESWIDWLEKQGKNNIGISEATKQKLEDNLNKALEKETPESCNEFLDEQNPADKVEPKFKAGDRVIGIVSGMQYYITEVCDDCYYTESGCTIMFYAQDNFELSKQTPAWSEEDKDVLEDIEEAIINYWHGQSQEDLLDWLKSLKDGVQPKQEWSEEDETVLNNLIYALANDRIGNNRDEYVDWLKSLRPQNRWKPSDEQLNALCWVLDKIKNYPIGGYSISVTHDLLKQLKAL